MLPTEKAENCIAMYYNGKIAKADWSDQLLTKAYRESAGVKVFQLYAISDDEITTKDKLNTEDYYYIKNHYNEWYIGKFNGYGFDFINNQGNFQSNLFIAKKIVATSDCNINESKTKEKDITYAMLPQFPESFINAFIKDYNSKNIITEVDLEMVDEFEGYESNFTMPKKLSIKTRPDNTVICHTSKMYSRDEIINFLKDWTFTNPTLVSDGHEEYSDSYKLSPKNLEDLKENL